QCQYLDKCKRSALPAASRALLFHGYAFSEVARFIDVAAERDREMVGEKLQGDDGQDGADAIGHVRNFDDLVGEALQLFRASARSDCDDRAFARFNLLDVVYVF